MFDTHDNSALHIPMDIPQGIWALAIVVFAIAVVTFTIRALILLLHSPKAVLEYAEASSEDEAGRITDAST